MKVLKKQLTKIDFENDPLEFTIQDGEIFGEKVKWFLPENSVLSWKESVNLEKQQGIQLDNEGWGYAGWDTTKYMYVRYSGCIQNEHAFRILYQ